MQYISKHSAFSTGMMATLICLLGFLLNLTTALPNPVPADYTDSGTGLNKRAPGQAGYCFDAIFFVENELDSSENRICCYYECCNLPRGALNWVLAIKSTTGGVRLWDSTRCTGNSIWVTSGWSEGGGIERKSDYYSMSSVPPLKKPTLPELGSLELR